MRYDTAVFLLILFLLTACQQPELVNGGFLAGHYAFVPHDNSVHLVDISNADNPHFVRHMDLPGPVSTVEIFGQRAFIHYVTPYPGGGYSPGGMQIVDVSDPTEPVLLGQMAQSDFTNELLVTNDRVFRARYDQIETLDVQDPANIRRELVFGRSANALAINGNALVAVWGGCSLRTGSCSAQLTRYDLTNLEEITITGELSNPAMPGFDLLLLENYALVGGFGVWVTDLTQSPLVVNHSTAFTGNPYYETQLAHQGNILYALQNDTLHLFDTTNLPTLVEVGSVTLPTVFANLAVRGDYAYITGKNPVGGPGGLLVVDVREAERPYLASFYDASQP